MLSKIITARGKKNTRLQFRLVPWDRSNLNWNFVLEMGLIGILSVYQQAHNRSRGNDNRALILALSNANSPLCSKSHSIWIWLDFESPDSFRKRKSNSGPMRERRKKTFIFNLGEITKCHLAPKLSRSVRECDGFKPFSDFGTTYKFFYKSIFNG